MPKNLRYNIFAVHLDSTNMDKRNHLSERIIYTFDDFEKARDKLIDLSIQADRKLNEFKYDYLYELNEMKDNFSDGTDETWYRIFFDEFNDYSDNKLYVGPGAYVLKGSLLQ